MFNGFVPSTIKLWKLFSQENKNSLMGYTKGLRKSTSKQLKKNKLYNCAHKKIFYTVN